MQRAGLLCIIKYHNRCWWGCGTGGGGGGGGWSVGGSACVFVGGGGGLGLRSIGPRGKVGHWLGGHVKENGAVVI